jgi:hypothetical protein
MKDVDVQRTIENLENVLRKDFYVYAYLREDGTPYYIGKGKNRRVFNKSNRTTPAPPKDRILIILENLTEEQAFANEKDFIAWYGRKDNGTGILRNLTDGGEGPSGALVSEETRKKLSEGNKRRLITGWTKGSRHTEETKKKISASMKGQIPWNKGKNKSY